MPPPRTTKRRRTGVTPTPVKYENSTSRQTSLDDSFDTTTATAHNARDATASEVQPADVPAALYTDDTTYTAIPTLQPKSVLLVLGDQLFNPEIIETHIFTHDRPAVYMAESDELCQHFKYHRIKLTLFLSAMRHYADEIKQRQWQVHYEKLTMNGTDVPYMQKFLSYCQQHRISHIYHYNISDLFFEQELDEWCTQSDIKHTCVNMSGFLTTRDQFSSYISTLKGGKKPFMATFYQLQRRRLNILIDGKTGKPTGGKFSYDTENRKALPKDVQVPDIDSLQHDNIDRDVIELINHRFSSHQGNAKDMWLCTTRAQAHAWLERFLHERFMSFGDYEDAITQRSAFVFHSCLTPYLNTGLLTAHEIVAATLKHNAQFPDAIPIASLEGFIRQVIGWREYINGLYHHFGKPLQESNYWLHHRQFKTDSFYTGTTGIQPLDDCIQKVNKYSYLHHIERLMICGSIFMLCEIEPSAVFRWYMELFTDSADWVMVANVYGMILNVDGGACGFTKPYVCGSNYMIKQSDGCYSKKQPWCDIVDGLYWRFIGKHRDVLVKNMRMGKMVLGLDRLSDARKKLIFGAAEKFLSEHTVLPDEYTDVDKQLYKTTHKPDVKVKVERNTVVID